MCRREKNQAEKKCADLAIRDFQSLGKTKLPRGPGARTQGESNPGQKGLRDRNSPTLSVTVRAYVDALIPRFGSQKSLEKGFRRGGEDPNPRKSRIGQSELPLCLPPPLLSFEKKTYTEASPDMPGHPRGHGGVELPAKISHMLIASKRPRQDFNPRCKMITHCWRPFGPRANILRLPARLI